ncbi:PAAR domain-containing protein [Vulcaniibacterium tengchongense]|uniref:PAAR domain-containing protein n=1 Tax=Vulcaniibacterium tengchongense TaxID=1273429 RepID=UPI001F5535C3|nr:PAAR domain-containing protein [Vulcaniibacterium tengchongense]
MSKPFIVVGDKTDHGGTVLTGSAETGIHGKAVARAGDPVQCPKCQGVFPIASGDASLIIDGRPLARHGDRTACGAALMARHHRGSRPRTATTDERVSRWRSVVRSCAADAPARFAPAARAPSPMGGGEAGCCGPAAPGLSKPAPRAHLRPRQARRLGGPPLPAGRTEGARSAPPGPSGASAYSRAWRFLSWSRLPVGDISPPAGGDLPLETGARHPGMRRLGGPGACVMLARFPATSPRR